MDKLFHHLRQARLEARRLEDAAQGLAKELAESEQMLGVSGAKWPPNSGGFSGWNGPNSGGFAEDSGGLLGVKNRPLKRKRSVLDFDENRPCSTGYDGNLLDQLAFAMVFTTIFLWLESCLWLQNMVENCWRIRWLRNVLPDSDGSSLFAFHVLVMVPIDTHIYGCESKCKAPIHTLNPQADPYPRSIPKRRWSRPIHTSGSPRADPYPNFDATPYIYIL